MTGRFSRPYFHINFFSELLKSANKRLASLALIAILTSYFHQVQAWAIFPNEKIGWSNGNTLPLGEVIGYQAEGKWGLMYLDQKKITKPIYESLTPIDMGRILAGKRQSPTSPVLFGVISPKGSTKIALQYHQLTPISDHYIATLAISGSMVSGLIDHKEHVVIPIQHKKIVQINSALFAAMNFEDRYALFDLSGRATTAFIIDRFGPTTDANFFSFNSAGAVGIFDRAGKVVVEPKYKHLSTPADGKIRAGSFGKWTLMDKTKQQRMEIEADSLISIASNLWVLHRNGFQALMSTQGIMSAYGAFDAVVPMGDFLVTKADGKYGLLTNDGKKVMSQEFEDIFVDQQFIFGKKKSWMIFDHKGRSLSQEAWDDFLSVGTDQVAVKQSGKWGIVDAKGQTKVACQYDSLVAYKSERWVAMNAGKYGVIDHTGAWLVPPMYSSISIIHKNLFLAYDGRHLLVDGQNNITYDSGNKLELHDFGVLERSAYGKLGLLNIYGYPALAVKYDYISNIQLGNYYILGRGVAYTLIDKNGRIIIPESAKAEEIFPFDGEFIGIKKDGKYGFLDTNGLLRIANQYEGVGKWSEDRGAVKLKGKWGYVDKLERLVVQPYYDEVWPYQSGISKVRIGELYGLIDNSGREVLPVNYDEVERYYDGTFIVRRGSKQGMANAEGRLTIQGIYDEVKAFGKGYFGVIINGKMGIKSVQNVDILPIIYQKAAYNPAMDALMYYQSGEEETIVLK